MASAKSPESTAQKRQFSAWGVMLGKTDFDVRMSPAFAGHGLAGIYLFIRNADHVVRTALLPTRQAAREKARDLKQTWPRAKPVRLNVVVEICSGTPPAGRGDG
jgi:hypothetical protein